MVPLNDLDVVHLARDNEALFVEESHLGFRLSFGSPVWQLSKTWQLIALLSSLDLCRPGLRCKFPLLRLVLPGRLAMRNVVHFLLCFSDEVMVSDLPRWFQVTILIDLNHRVERGLL